MHVVCKLNIFNFIVFFFHRSCFVCIDYKLFFWYYMYILYMILLYSFCLSGVWIFIFALICVNLCFSGVQYAFHIIGCSYRFHSIMLILYPELSFLLHTLHICQRPFYKIFVKFRNSKKNVLKIVLIIVNINKDENKSLISNQFSLKIWDRF